jgi:serine/threonine protein kinase
MSASTLQAGDILGSWIVDRSLGRGGQASVFAAHHRAIPDLKAALKVFQTENDEQRAIVFNEAQILSRIKHPCVVGLTDIGDDPARGVVFLVLDLVQGEALDTRLQSGRMAREEALALFSQLFEALEAVHAKGLAHRDIKPSNLLIRPNGTPCLIDFGIALGRGLPGSETDEFLTPRYAAPEQLTEEADAAIPPPDPRAADVFSLGQCLFEALTGWLAFPASPENAIEEKRAMSKPLDPGPAFSTGLRELMAGVSEPSPARRLTAAQARVRLQPILRESGTERVSLGARSDGSPAPSPPRASLPRKADVPAPAPIRSPARHVSLGMIGAAAFFGVFVGALAVYALFQGRIDRMLRDAGFSLSLTPATPSEPDGTATRSPAPAQDGAPESEPTLIPANGIGEETPRDPSDQTAADPCLALTGRDRETCVAASASASRAVPATTPTSVVALGGLRISPDDALVQVDGVSLGPARGLVTRRLLPGRHLVEVIREGMRSARLVVEVDSDQRPSIVQN